MKVSKKSKQPELSGLVVVDKPLGVTSHDVVAAVRGEFHMRRVGHAGTLDPQASGVLVIGFGHGTRLLNYIVDHTKTYEATIRLGQTSTTDDSEGVITIVAPVELADGIESDAAEVVPVRLADGAESGAAEVAPVKLADSFGVGAAKVVPEVLTGGSGNGVVVHEKGNSPAVSKDERDSDERSHKSPSEAETNGGSSWFFDSGMACGRGSGNVRVLTLQQIEHAIKEHLTGDIEQVPSSYSAVRVNGRHAYELARQGKAVELDARPVTISEFTVLGARNAEARTDELDAENSANGSVGAATSVVDVDVRISCSTGTYIRSLGRDLGQLLGVGGYLTKLRRTRVGKFDLADLQLAGRVVTAHAKPHTFTNREGVTLTLNKAVLDVDADELEHRSLTMLEAAQRTMPVLPITQHDAAELRYGRRLKMNLDQAAGEVSEIVEANGDTDKVSSDVVSSVVRSASSIQFAAAYVPETGEVVAILEPANVHEVKSALVFPEKRP